MDNKELASRSKEGRARTEMEILEFLDHPFLPSLYAVINSPKWFCLLTEFCAGGDLHVLRQRQPLNHSAVSIAYSTTNDVSGESIDGSTQALDQVVSTDMKQVMLVKALLNAHDTLLAELQKLSDAINHAVDLTELTSKMNDMKLFDSFLQEPVGADAEDSAQGKARNGLERVNGRLEFQSDRLVHNLSKDDVLKIFNLSGDQVFYLWNTFLNFRSCTLNCFEYLIFRMWRNGHEGIYAAALGGYRTSASFGSVNPTILMP
ncbi:uncharacterized protein LOC105772509 [Gossypium raimondii]|uniref:uncharacterized protein LOC105772509 n=1 Tax=Gossypium raimondii TaxID=29730 RepID=UPI00227A085E|nr:uncharacterized protein LOC105772509 [Gossypium raimondii]XP_052488528.1 uncharacterized protein LOC105772509 [Gossypium raimondii]